MYTFYRAGVQMMSGCYESNEMRYEVVKDRFYGSSLVHFRASSHKRTKLLISKINQSFVCPKQHFCNPPSQLAV